MANETINQLPPAVSLTGLERVPIAQLSGGNYVTVYTTVAGIAAAKNIQAFLNGSTSGTTILQATAVASGTITFPAATDQLVARATTDTLTNKTYDTAGTGNVLKINGVQVSAVTGTGAVVLANTPTFITPVLGAATGTSLNLSGLTASQGVATDASKNLISVAQTGTGSNVLSISPVMTGTPTVPTQTAGDNTQNIASTAFVTTAVTAHAVRTQVFNASGTYTPNVNMLYAQIECVGGGGGGGGAIASTSGTINGAGGGGAGAYSRIIVSKATVGASQTVTVGAAGAAGAAGTNNGGTGGDTSVGSLCVAKGGVGGVGCAAGTATAGGAGGLASSGTGAVTINGGNGGPGRSATITTVQIPSGGCGGSNCLGQGATATTDGNAGNTGYGPGGGGSGATDSNAGGSKAGGAGIIGIVIITEFCSA